MENKIFNINVSHPNMGAINWDIKILNYQLHCQNNIHARIFFKKISRSMQYIQYNFLILWGEHCAIYLPLIGINN